MNRRRKDKSQKNRIKNQQKEDSNACVKDKAMSPRIKIGKSLTLLMAGKGTKDNFGNDRKDILCEFKDLWIADSWCLGSSPFLTLF